MNDSSDQPSRSWSRLRQLMLTLAIVATAIALFYTEEDWRGKREWERYKGELEAQGWVLDWNQRIPQPVPDDQNFFMASTNIRIRFVKTQNDAEYAAATNLNWLKPGFNGYPQVIFTKTNEPVMAEITVVAPDQKNTASPEAMTWIDLRDAGVDDSLQQLLRQHIGTGRVGAAGFHFSEKDLSQLPPLHITLVADAPQTSETLSQLIPPGLATNLGVLGIKGGDQAGQFEVRFVSGGATPAARYLEWDEQSTPGFAEVREALKRPYALIPGDYSEPWSRPIPDFVTLRWFAQWQAMRAQCHLLLHEPDKAAENLILVHDICRILEHRPNGHPMTLVEAMINVAIHALYVAVVQEGLGSHEWREPDLAAIQKQLAETDLHAPVLSGFEDEQISTIWNGERPDFIKRYMRELAAYGQTTAFHTWLQAWMYQLMPRGWDYENIKTAVELYQQGFSDVSLTNQQVFPTALPKVESKIEASLSRSSPFYILSGIAIPNFIKAFENYAYTQTLVNEGQIACALERYKLANGSYPDTLEQVTPNFIETLPLDVIGGQPLHYRRTDDGKFLLYSVGWNEKDDGGTVALDHQGKEDRNQGDWVWHYQAN